MRYSLLILPLLAASSVFADEMQAPPHGLLPAAYEDAEVIAQGKALHLDYCSACHGENLEGAENWKQLDADGMRQAPPHSGDGHMWHHSDVQNFMITKFGVEAVAGNGTTSNMPGFVDLLTDQEIASVLAFIKSTWPAHVVAAHNKANEGGHH